MNKFFKKTSIFLLAMGFIVGFSNGALEDFALHLSGTILDTNEQVNMRNYRNNGSNTIQNELYATSGSKLRLDFGLVNYKSTGCVITNFRRFLNQNWYGNLELRQNGFTPNNSTITWNIPEYHSGRWNRSRYQRTTGIVLDLGGQGWNQNDYNVSVSLNYSCSDGTNGNLSNILYIRPTADLRVSKELIGIPPSKTGDQVRYRINLYNKGMTSANNYLSYDNFPHSFVDYVGSTLGLATISGTTNWYYWNGQNIGVGQTGYFEVWGTIKDNANYCNTNFTNRAMVQNLQHEIDKSDNNSSVTICRENRGIDFTWTGDKQYAISGTDVDFTLGFENLVGSNPDYECDVDLFYTLPNGVDFVSSTRQGFRPYPDVTQDHHVHLNVGQSYNNYATVTTKVSLQSWSENQLPVTLTANYTCSNGKYSFSDTYNKTLYIKPISELIITKTGLNQTCLTTGDVAHYQIKIKNIGSKIANGYGLYEDIDSHLSNPYLTINGSTEHFSLNGSRFYYSGSRLNINPGNILTVDVFGTLDNISGNPGKLTNTAELDAVNQYDTTTTDIVSYNDLCYVKRDFSVSLTPNEQNAISGSNLDFDINITNNGDENCSVETRYTTTNGVKSNDTSWGENTHQTFVVNNGNTWNYKVNSSILMGNWTNNSQYLALNVKYNCGDGEKTYQTLYSYVQPISELSVNKTLFSLPPSHTGDEVKYKLDIYNIGSQSANSYSICDSLNSQSFLSNIKFEINNYEYIPVFNSLTNEYCIYDGQDGVNLNVPSMNNNGQSGHIEVFVKGNLISNSDTSTNYCNSVVLNVNDYDVTNNSLSNVACTNVQIRDVDFQISPDIQYGKSGDVVGFNIDIKNNGTVDCTGKIKYSLDNGLSWYSSIVNGSSISWNENMLLDNINLQHGQSYNNYASVDLLVDSSSWTNSLNINMEAQYKCDGAERKTINQTIQVLPYSFMQITGYLENIGSDVIYHLNLENIGSSLASLYSLNFDFPNSLNYINSLFGNSYQIPDLMSPGFLSWSGSYLNLNPSQNINVDITTKLTNGMCIGSTVGSSSFGFTNVSGNNITINGFTVKGTDLVITDIIKTTSDPERVGDPVGFEIHYTNSGNIVATGAKLYGVIQDLLDLNTLETNITHKPFVSSNGNIEIERDLGNVAQGTNGIIRLTGYLKSDYYIPGTLLCLNSSIASDLTEDICGTNLNNNLSGCYQITGTMNDLSIEKTMITDVDIIGSGDLVTYDLIITNNGDNEANDIKVEDILPFWINYNSYSIGSEFNGGNCSYNLGKLICNGMSLQVHQIGHITVIGTLTQLPLEGLDLVNTGIVDYSGRDMITGNNLFVLVSHIPGLANIVVNKEVSGDMPAGKGDKMLYTITYSNVGYRTATNLQVFDVLGFSGLEFDNDTNPKPQNWDWTNNSGVWGGGDELAPGEQKTITFVSHLKDWYSVGTLLPNSVCIYTNTPEFDTGDNCDIATGYIQKKEELSVDISVLNLTRENTDLNRWNENNPIYGVSGDLVQFTINYFNSGNVNLSGVTIRFNPVWSDGEQHLSYFMPQSFTISSLPFASGGSIVITGYVGPQNYIHLSGFVYIFDSPYSENEFDSDVAGVVEPLGCGDGFITRNETCDTNGPDGNVLGDLLPGQVCEIQQNDPSLGCVALTKYVINTGCVDFDYIIGGVFYTGQVCDTIVPVPVGEASCDYMSKTSEIEVNGTGLDVTLSCQGNGTNINTHIQIDCGNGQIINGYGNILTGVCNYIGTGESVSIFTAQCKVGNDIDNSNCSVDSSIYPNGKTMCSSLQANDGSVLLLDNGSNDGNLRFTCLSDGGTGKIDIDCNYDGRTFNSDVSREGVSSLTYSCNFTDDNRNYNVACRVDDGDVLPACLQGVRVDKRTLGHCGDGIINNGYEQCDLGGNIGEKKNIGLYLDNSGTIAPEMYKNSGWYCMNCALKHDKLDYNPPACFNISNMNISVQKDEILPFWWNLEVDRKNISSDLNGECTPGDINKNMLCKFKIMNGKGEFYNFDVENCYDKDQRDGKKILESFEKKVNNISNNSLKNTAGKYFVSMKKILGNEKNPVLGEYSLMLDEVRYKYCNESGYWSDGNVVDRLCMSNFVVTSPYLIQKTPFGAVKSVNSDEYDISLDKFYAFMPGETDYNILKKTDIDDIMEVVSSNYTVNIDLKKSINDFIEKYGVIAQKIEGTESIKLDKGIISEIRKVPAKEIYVVKGSGTLTIAQKSKYFPGKSYTLIVKGMDLELQGTVKTNGMFIVVPDEKGDGGKITFSYADDGSCDVSQIVDGIFIALDGFDLNPSAKIKNDLNSDRRCDNGTLVVKGILIGKNIDKLVENRRSHLNTWFYVRGDESTKKTERRDLIFDGASVLIENNMELRNNLPDGASELVNKLDVYKK